MIDAPWSERYRPKTIDECILPDRIRSDAEGFIEKGAIPNLLLSGSAGRGKTTFARALASQLDYDVLFINGSNEGRFLDTLRNRIQQFASSVALSGNRKVVILDEADHLPADTVQAALRGFIEEYSDNCSFILTCNYPNKILEPIRSRTAEIVFNVPQEEKNDLLKETAKRVLNILTENDVDHDPKAVVAIVKERFPDFRKILNDLQRYSATGKIDSGSLSDVVNRTYSELVTALQERKFNDMRKWVGREASLDIVSVSRYLYDNSDEFIKNESIPELVLILADYQYHNAFVADKEINLVAMLTKIMIECEFK